MCKQGYKGNPYLYGGCQGTYLLYYTSTVRAVSDMVVDEPEEPIFVILQIKQTTSGGIRQSHFDAFVSFYLKCISLLYHNEQSKLPVQ
jgi:hypothetical protein